MGTEIDRLEVQIETKATKVNNSLDTLVTKLDRVSSALSHINSSGLTGLSNGVAKFAQASAQLSNVRTADFTRLTRNIQNLANLNTQQIFGAASAMRTLSTAINSLGGVSANSLQVAEVANSISKLGGANVQRAITNLPALASAMNNLMVTLSRAPQVNRSIIDMTNALANLAAQGNRVGTAGNSLIRSLNTTGTAMTSATKKAWSLSSALGSIYQKYFWIRRIGNKLWDSIEESMDYVETLNYFNAAFEQVADAAVSQWEEAGCDSADAYYNSFSDRARQLTTKMTDFTITESGMLESIGGKSLGINPSTLMNYQAMFAQMSNSMGVTAETSLKLSTALTEIGADLASVKNMDFDKVWTDMASGLAGMSRTLDKYGANIRNVNLQQKLFDLGINANVTALNQNDKALLRTIILLDSTRYAWGDLADTIDKPANQLRLLKSNFNNLARTIGNIFLPIVAKVLPYLNAVVIALQRLAEWIVKLLGFEDFDWGGSGGVGDGGLDDLIGDIGDTEDGLDDATKAAKKLKNQLQGFDELNVISISDDSTGAGIGSGAYDGLLEGALDKILEEYQKAWDEAFDAMEERFDEFADNVAKAYKEKGLYGVGEYFSQLLTDALNNIKWEEIYEGAKDFGKGLAEFLNGLISPELFAAVGKTIAGALNTAIYAALSFGENFDWKNLGYSLANGINEFFKTFDFVALAEVFNTWAKGIIESLSTSIKETDWKAIGESLGTLITKIDFLEIAVNLSGLVISLVSAIGDAIISFAETAPLETAIVGLFGLMKFTGLDSIIGTAISNALAAHGISLKKVTIGLSLALATFKLADSDNELSNLIGAPITAFLSTYTFTGDVKVSLKISAVILAWDIGSDIGKELGKMLFPEDAEWYDNFSWFGKDGFFDTIFNADPDVLLDALGDMFSDIWDEICKEWDMTCGLFDASSFFFEKIGEDFKNKDWGAIGLDIINGIISGILGAFSIITEPFVDIFTWLWDGLCGIFGIHSPAKEMEPIGEFILLGVVEGFSNKVSEFVKAIQEWFDKYVSPWFTKEKWSGLWENVKSAFTDMWNKIKDWWNNTALVKWWNNDVKPWFTKEKWSGILKGIGDAFGDIWDGIKKSFDDIFGGIFDDVDKLTEKIGGVTTTTGALGKGIGSALSSTGKTIPAYAIGGFPEDGLFFANHNELVGKFSNGRTAVANNEQITDGIYSAVRDANYETNALLRNLIQTVKDSGDMSVSVNGKEIIKVVKRENRIYKKSTGRGMFDN